MNTIITKTLKINGYECIILFTDRGYYNAYVAIPETSRFHNVHYNNKIYNDIDVHGGITFSQNNTFVKYEDGWFIGFDCIHCDDAVNESLVNKYFNKDIVGIPITNDCSIFRDEQFVENELIKLTQQLLNKEPTLIKIVIDKTIKRELLWVKNDKLNCYCNVKKDIDDGSYYINYNNDCEILNLIEDPYYKNIIDYSKDKDDVLTGLYFFYNAFFDYDSEYGDNDDAGFLVDLNKNLILSRFPRVLEYNENYCRHDDWYESKDILNIENQHLNIPFDFTDYTMINRIYGMKPEYKNYEVIDFDFITKKIGIVKMLED